MTSPILTKAESLRRTLLYHFSCVQVPQIVLPRDRFDAHLDRTFALYRAKSEPPLIWSTYLDGLYIIDWFVCMGCLEGYATSWDILFAARTGRSDCLLVDALRARAL